MPPNAQLKTREVLHNIRASPDIGDAPIIISVMTVAEIAHGIYRASTPERRLAGSLSMN